MPLKKIAEPTNEERCLSQEHEPPAHIYLEPGTYEYTCPQCSKKTIFEVPLITY